MIDASGLADVIAAAAVTRACARAGVEPARLDGAGLQRALPHLEVTVRLYLREQAEPYIATLRRLTEAGPAGSHGAPSSPRSH